MQEEAQKILIEMLKKASDGVDAAVSFSQAQIPDVVHQLLVWKFASSIVVMIVGLCLLFTALLTARMILISYSKANVRDGSWVIDNSFEYVKSISFTASAVILFCVIIFVVSILVVINSFDWLKIWLAPKLYLIEYAASLIK
ncbi:TPA: hypothetical protein I8235_000030 [Kluyvera intermedia]|nr:hypothetical protein [Kluyvera intermedia]